MARPVGRRRTRWRVSDFPNRIDAQTVRQQAKAEGVDLLALRWIDVRPADKPDGPGERVALEVVRDALCGPRVWLLCPRCCRRCRHLFPTVSGITCRQCAAIGYARAL